MDRDLVSNLIREVIAENISTILGHPRPKAMPLSSKVSKIKHFHFHFHLRVFFLYEVYNETGVALSIINAQINALFRVSPPFPRPGYLQVKRPSYNECSPIHPHGEKTSLIVR